MNDNLIKLYTSDEVTISRIKQELETADINCLVKDGFKQGLAAGFGNGVPSAVDIFVVETDMKKAQEILHALTNE